MSDSYSSDPQQQGGQGEGGREGYRGDGGRTGNRGGHSSGSREGGGFRIRLSDNEMRSARALQEAFNLRSTVAVLGFALRTLGQMLEDGQLDELVEQQRSQAPKGGRREGGRDGGGRGRRFNDDRQGGGGRGSRPDPFARPAKPQPAEAESEPPVQDEPGDVVDTAIDGESGEAVTSHDPAPAETVEPTTDDQTKPAEA